MIGRIYVIALNTFREAVRGKVLWAILVLVIALNLFGLVMGEMSLHEEARVARDLGLGAASFFGSILAMLLGVTLLYNEIQKKTLYMILAKPIHRWEFVLGKYLGMIATVTIMVAGFALALALLLALQDVAFTAAVLKSLVLSYLSILIVAALAIFFSAFSTPILSGVFTFLVFFLGRVTPELRSAVETAKSEWIRVVCRAGLKILPDLHIFSVSGGVVDGEHVSVHRSFVEWSYVATAGGYALAYTVALLVLAMLIFSRRDFA